MPSLHMYTRRDRYLVINIWSVAISVNRVTRLFDKTDFLGVFFSENASGAIWVTGGELINVQFPLLFM